MDKVFYHAPLTLQPEPGQSSPGEPCGRLLVQASSVEAALELSLRWLDQFTERMGNTLLAMLVETPIHRPDLIRDTKYRPADGVIAADLFWERITPKPDPAEILKQAEHQVEALKAAGWTQQDFARALGEMLSGGNMPKHNPAPGKVVQKFKFVGELTMEVPADLPEEDQRRLAFAVARLHVNPHELPSQHMHKKFLRRVPMEFHNQWSKLDFVAASVSFVDTAGLTYPDDRLQPEDTA